ncbi:hypothetical protein FOL46_004302, partial [Perkinsus olseni]
ANLEDIERQEGTGSPRDVLIDKEIGPEDSVSACIHHHHHQAPIPVSHHCKHLEELLYESGAGEFKVTPSLGQAFHPFGHLRHACIQKLLASLQKCPAVLERAQSAFSTYGNESVLSLEMEKRMRALKFGGVREVDNYIKDCVCAFEIY